MLRGVAVGLVMLSHAWPDVFGGAGIVGVVVFFALSGYLITGVLERDLQLTGHVRYGRFYVHRFFRLYPALVALIAGYCLVDSLAGVIAASRQAESAFFGLFYLSDVPGIELVPGLGHLWTLAVEEQFYLLWPLVLTYALTRGRVRVVFLGAAAVLVAASVAVAETPLSTYMVYKSPTSWAIALLIGAAARVGRERIVAVARRPVSRAAAAAVLAGLCFVPRAEDHVAYFLVAGPVIAVAGVVVVLSLETVPTVRPVLRPLLGLGTISYAAYLVNFPIVTKLSADLRHDMSVGLGLLSIVATILAATASWFTVEKVGRMLRSRYDRRAAAREAAATPPALEGLRSNPAN